jgi:hypothetical protein
VHLDTKIFYKHTVHLDNKIFHKHAVHSWY